MVINKDLKIEAIGTRKELVLFHKGIPLDVAMSVTKSPEAEVKRVAMYLWEEI